MSRRGADACRNYWSRRSLRLSVGGLVAAAAVVLLFGFGTTPRAAACTIVGGPGYDVTQPPILSSGLSGQTPDVGQPGQTLTVTEGHWSQNLADCSPQIRSIHYQFYRDATAISSSDASGYFSTFDTPALASLPYTTESGDVGHAVTAVVTACDYIDCTSYGAVGSFVPTDHTPSGAKVGVNSVCSDNPATAPYDAQAHSQWARISVSWDSYETSLGHYDNAVLISTLQSCVQRLHSAGEKVLVVLRRSACYYTPAWSGSLTTGTCDHTAYNNNDYKAHVPTATDTPNFTSYASDFGSAANNLVSTDLHGANTCGIAGSGHENLCGVQAFEAWNEETDPLLWGGSKAQYETLLKQAYDQVSSATYPDAQGNPVANVQVVLGSPGGGIQYAWTKGLLDDEQNTANTARRCPHDRATGVSTYICFDVLGVHPYMKCYASSCPENDIIYGDTPDIPTILNDRNKSGGVSNPDTLNNLAATLNSHGLGATGSTPAIPVWITEMGARVGEDYVQTDAEYAHMVTNFYNYINEQPVVSKCTSTETGCDTHNEKTYTCPASTCDRIKVGMWYADTAGDAGTAGDDPSYSIFNVYDFETNPDTLSYDPKPAWAALMNLN